MPFRDAFDPARALESAWAGVRRAPWILLLGGLLLSFFHPALHGAASGDEEVRREWLKLLIPAILLGCGCGLLVVWLLYSWFYAGFVNTCSRLYRTGAVEIGELFSDRGRFVSIFVVCLLRFGVFGLTVVPVAAIFFASFLLHQEARIDDDITIPAGVLASLLYLPVAIYVWLGFGLAKLCAAVDGLGPVEAMGRSWDLVRGNRWLFLVYAVLMCFVTLLGVLCCCFPVVFTTAWTEAAYVDSYLALTRGEERTGWWIALPEGEREQVALTPHKAGTENG